MLREIIEGASYGEDYELTLHQVNSLIKDINAKNATDADARTYQSLEKAKVELEKVLRRI